MQVMLGGGAQKMPAPGSQGPMGTPKNSHGLGPQLKADEEYLGFSQISNLPLLAAVFGLLDLRTVDFCVQEKVGIISRLFTSVDLLINLLNRTGSL